MVKNVSIDSEMNYTEFQIQFIKKNTILLGKRYESSISQGVKRMNDV